MKTRWKYLDLKRIEKGKYLKVKQFLIWRFYLRVIKEWFTPCKACRNMIDDMWMLALDAAFYKDFIWKTSCNLCEKCLEKIKQFKENSEVILGNNDYDPPIELSRKWLDSDDEDDIIEITKKEYLVAKKEYSV